MAVITKSAANGLCVVFQGDSCGYGVWIYGQYVATIDRSETNARKWTIVRSGQDDITVGSMQAAAEVLAADYEREFNAEADIYPAAGCLSAAAMAYAEEIAEALAERQDPEPETCSQCGSVLIVNSAAAYCQSCADAMQALAADTAAPVCDICGLPADGEISESDLCGVVRLCASGCQGYCAVAFSDAMDTADGDESASRDSVISLARNLCAGYLCAEARRFAETGQTHAAAQVQAMRSRVLALRAAMPQNAGAPVQTYCLACGEPVTLTDAGVLAADGSEHACVNAPDAAHLCADCGMALSGATGEHPALADGDESRCADCYLPAERIGRTPEYVDAFVAFAQADAAAQAERAAQPQTPVYQFACAACRAEYFAAEPVAPDWLCGLCEMQGKAICVDCLRECSAEAGAEIVRPGEPGETRCTSCRIRHDIETAERLENAALAPETGAQDMADYLAEARAFRMAAHDAGFAQRAQDAGNPLCAVCGSALMVYVDAIICESCETRQRQAELCATFGVPATPENMASVEDRCIFCRQIVCRCDSPWQTAEALAAELLPVAAPALHVSAVKPGSDYRTLWLADADDIISAHFCLVRPGSRLYWLCDGVLHTSGSERLPSGQFYVCADVPDMAYALPAFCESTVQAWPEDMQALYASVQAVSHWPGASMTYGSLARTSGHFAQPDAAENAGEPEIAEPACERCGSAAFHQNADGICTVCGNGLPECERCGSPGCNSRECEPQMLTERQARAIAADWHHGQASALYALSSTGAIDVRDCERDILREMRSETLPAQYLPELAALLAYVLATGERLPGQPHSLPSQRRQPGV